MKLHMLSMFVHHGDYRRSEARCGNSTSECLLALLETPIGIGYAPKAGSPQFETLVAKLDESGTAQWGWGDYTLTTVGAADGPTAEQCNDILGKHHYST